MPDNNKLVAAVEDYFDDLRKIKASGGGTAETSYYPPLSNLLNAVGGSLKPRVFCLSQLAQQGADHPDFGIFAAKQVSKDQPKQGQLPEGGVVEVKPASDDAWLTADSAQVSKYWGLYRLVLVTNTRDFVLLGEDANGNPTKLETFRLAASAAEFDKELQHPRAFANKAGPALAGYLGRALSNRATLVEPRDLAALIAFYAREALARVETSGEASSLHSLQDDLEKALGVTFTGEDGAAFFRSSLVQTLFYGVFSAWVLWARQIPPPNGNFNWRLAAWRLRVPVLQALFEELARQTRLQPLDLVEVLDWTEAALNRVDRQTFFIKFNEGEAVQYFYEPFLEAFDPALRKQLGVWYTPVEVVRYMVARVDRALKDDLGIEDGLAAENVYVLDPCCGTGAYLAETLRRIACNLDAKGPDALKGAYLRRAATERVFGFEIMPAPFVVAHLQVGLTMQDLGAAFSEDGKERAGVFLTNALTGWEKNGDAESKQLSMYIPELEEERDRAERVKQNTPVLVIMGNPPYNGRAGRAGRPGKAFEDSLTVEEERGLSEAYRSTNNVKDPEGQGLNDLYVRFFRMAERRIAEMTGKGIVCFISNYSWLDGLSFTGMREHYLEGFDVIRIDNLHGDRIISEYAPDGRTSETVFAIRGQSSGIRIGTAITLLSKSKADPGESPYARLLYRDFDDARAEERREALLWSLEKADIDSGYTEIQPHLEIGLPFKPMDVNQGWSKWPSLPDLFPQFFPGVQTKRDAFLIDTERDKLSGRVGKYFDSEFSNSEIGAKYPAAMHSSSGFVVSNAQLVRNSLLDRGGPINDNFIRHAYRPFDTRWLYWEAGHGLLGRPVPEYKPHVFVGNLALVSQQKPRREWSPPQVISQMGCLDLIDRGATCFPIWLRDEQPDGQQSMLDVDGEQRRPNLSAEAQAYLDQMGLGVEDLFPPRPGGAARPGLPGGQRGGAADGVAPHPAARLARRRRPRGGRQAAHLRSPRTGAGSIAGPGDAGAGSDVRHAAPGAGGHRSPYHRRRAQHGRRRLRAHRRLGPLRHRRHRHARHRPLSGARLHHIRAGSIRRRRRDSGRQHPRHPPERQRPLEQRPRRRLELQAGRLPGPQKVALLPRAQGPRP